MAAIIINSLINTGLTTGQAVSSVPAECTAALCGAGNCLTTQRVIQPLRSFPIS